jgi:benzoyl-CoA reductase subunit D
MKITAGIDIGANSVKAAIVSWNGTAASGASLKGAGPGDGTPEPGGMNPQPIALVMERIRRRDIRSVVAGTYERALTKAGLTREQVHYVASTGAGEMADFRTGHFYGMTSHARGASFLDPEVRTVMDLGAFHARAMRVSEESRVLAHKMTGQCASGSGQFIENIARYLGVPITEVGELSLKATGEEQPSGICAVLAETDVINMVSRGIPAEDILRGIHRSVATRLVKLLASVKAESPLLVTGGMALNVGLVEALREQAVANDVALEIRTHPHSALAGALGAALWAGWRLKKLEREAAAA